MSKSDVEWEEMLEWMNGRIPIGMWILLYNLTHKNENNIDAA